MPLPDDWRAFIESLNSLPGVSFDQAWAGRVEMYTCILREAS